MTGDIGTYIVFALGILVGGILFSKDFRQKFFKSFRKFLGSVSKGAQDMNKRTSDYGSNKKQEYKKLPKEKPEVQHIYKEVHQRVACSVCQGSGRVYEKVGSLQKGAPGCKPRIITCPECEGEGKVWS